MTTYATAADVAARWGKDPATLDSAITSLITKRLGDAERMIERRLKDLGLPTLADQITAGTIDEADVEQVECEAVLRLARNPEGFQSEGDGNYQYMLMQDIASGTLEILPVEWNILGVATQGMFVIIPTPRLGV